MVWLRIEYQELSSNSIAPDTVYGFHTPPDSTLSGNARLVSAQLELARLLRTAYWRSSVLIHALQDTDISGNVPADPRSANLLRHEAIRTKLRSCLSFKARLGISPDSAGRQIC
jgi:hypothetical protein